MNNREVQIDMEVISRWESMGMLEGLPLWEKEELAILFDNTVRLTLSKKTVDRIPQNVYDRFTDVNLPIVRRLYRRIGPHFSLDRMLSEMIESVDKKMDYLSGEVTPESNPIVDFCIEFADNYEDEISSKKQLTNEEYTERVDNMLEYVRQVLLSDKMVTNVDKTSERWELKLSDTKKPQHTIRFWNQKTAKELLQFTLSDINKGLK
jgi:hypothetical protein